MLYCYLFFFFFNDTATTEIYTLSLHDALPIYDRAHRGGDAQQEAQRGLDRDVQRAEHDRQQQQRQADDDDDVARQQIGRDTSELQSRQYLVCRLLLEKKKKALVVTLISE